MGNKSSWGKMYFIFFYSVNVKGNWTHLAQTQDQVLGSMQFLGYQENFLIVLVLP